MSETNINWYPGHMAKTKKQITEDLKLVDLVIEILDCRTPLSSQNPDIGKITENKDKIIILNKCDLADPKQNELWKEYFKKKGQTVILTQCNESKGIDVVIKEIEKIREIKLEDYLKKGRVGAKIRAMVIGIPNCGKSTFINKMNKSNSLEVGNKPGVTRKKQWIRVNDKIELLDTPGVLWPKFESEEVSLNLSCTGTIKDEIIPTVDVAYYLVKILLKNYRSELIKRYNLTEEYIEKVLDMPNPENVNIYEIMQEIGRKRGCIISGGEIDDEKTSKIILDDFRKGRIGRITLEQIN